jgi:hypothetical protein
MFASRCAALVALVVCMLAAPVAAAWGPEGHRIVAALAQRQLTPQAAAAVQRLLAPIHVHDLADIANWADDLRHDPAQQALWKSTRALHYVNFPRGDCHYVAPRDCPDGRCVVAAIDRYAAILGDRSRSAAERLQALEFVVHFVGDVHQPLHAGYRDDLGGNRFQVRMDGQGSNLHRVWDSGLLDTRHLPWMAYAQRLADDGPVVLPPTVAAVDAPAQWAEESCRIVRDDGVYPPGRDITPAYVQAERPIAERRLKEAGARLATLLNRLLAP